MYMYIEKTKYGYRIQTFSKPCNDEKIHYIGYSKKNAIKKHRETYGLKYKHLNIVEW